MAVPTRAFVFHLADLVAGRLQGNPCPSCGARGAAEVVKKHLGLGSISRCPRCELLFRPTGLQSGRVARWYYSNVYADPGIATEPRQEDRASALARARAADKDRSALLAPLLTALPEGERRVGFLGASWGYELLCCEHLGVPLWGYEPGAPRREHGRTTFGLDLFARIEDAAAAGRRGGIVFSSHALEHVPRLEALLDLVDERIAPALHVHVTPRVDPQTPDIIGSVIGREHPLGVTEAFWRRRAAARGLVARVLAHRAGTSGPYDETLALLGRPDVIDAAALAGVVLSGAT